MRMVGGCWAAVAVGAVSSAPSRATTHRLTPASAALKAAGEARAGAPAADRAPPRGGRGGGPGGGGAARAARPWVRPVRGGRQGGVRGGFAQPGVEARFVAHAEGGVQRQFGGGGQPLAALEPVQE